MSNEQNSYTLSEEEKQSLRDLSQQVTQGYWKAAGTKALGLSEVIAPDAEFRDGHLVCSVNGQYGKDDGSCGFLPRQLVEANATLIAKSREAVPCLLDEIDRHKKENVQLKEKNDEMEQLFDLQCDADRRGSKLWQDAGKGREKTWPDKAKLVVWLLEELDAAKIIIAAARNTELKQYDTPELDDHGVACLDLALQIKAYDARHKAEEGEL